MRTPPTALTKTSCSQVAMPACRCSTASSMARRFASRPTESRRAFGVCAGSTSAWISTSSGRVPSSVARTQEPGTACRGAATGTAREGFDDAAQPLLGHGEHAELVHRAEAVLRRAHQAERRVRIALEVEHRVDDVLEHARPGDRAFLGDVADQEERGAGALGVARELRGALAHLRHRAGRRLQASPTRASGSSRSPPRAAAPPRARRARARAASRRRCARRRLRALSRRARSATCSTDSSPVT